MKTFLVCTLVVLIITQGTEETQIAKQHQRRSYNHLEWNNAPFQQTSAAINKYLDINLAPPPPPIGPIYLTTNSIEKPVEEAQEYIPPQSIGTAIIPSLPPPATPVNAAASNVRASQGAVFLGSGALGVVSLGNGAYALGSGSLGYSENRARTRPSSNVPVFPPLPATPDLIPAAVPSQQATTQLTPINSLNFHHPLLNNNGGVPQFDANGYEYLPPERVGFGMPRLGIQRVRFTQQFATPTVQQQQQPPPPPNGYQLTIPFNVQNGHPLAKIG